MLYVSILAPNHSFLTSLSPHHGPAHYLHRPDELREVDTLSKAAQLVNNPPELEAGSHEPKPRGQPARPGAEAHVSSGAVTQAEVTAETAVLCVLWDVKGSSRKLPSLVHHFSVFLLSSLSLLGVRHGKEAPTGRVA